MSTSTSQRGSRAGSAAAIEDEQPSPYDSFSTTSAPRRSTFARTSSAPPPSVTRSWSNPQARAESSTGPSSVVPSYGSVCLGRPRRLDPPAASTRPATKSLSGREIRLELFPATLAAEPPHVPDPPPGPARPAGGRRPTPRYLHAADGVDRRPRRRERLPSLADAHDL